MQNLETDFTIRIYVKQFINYFVFYNFVCNNCSFIEFVLQNTALNVKSIIMTYSVDSVK